MTAGASAGGEWLRAARVFLERLLTQERPRPRILGRGTRPARSASSFAWLHAGSLVIFIAWMAASNALVSLGRRCSYCKRSPLFGPCAASLMSMQLPLNGVCLAAWDPQAGPADRGGGGLRYGRGPTTHTHSPAADRRGRKRARGRCPRPGRPGRFERPSRQTLFTADSHRRRAHESARPPASRLGTRRAPAPRIPPAAVATSRSGQRRCRRACTTAAQAAGYPAGLDAVRGRPAAPATTVSTNQMKAFDQDSRAPV